MELSFLEQGNLPIRLHIVSKTQGRIRLRIAPEHRQDEVMTGIKHLIETFLDGIEHIRTNTQTGSVVIYFTGEIAQLEDAFSTLNASGIVLNDTPTEKSTAAARLTTAISGLNQRVNLATEGTIDLRFLFPLLLALLALRQLFSKSPRLNTAPWYILAWYAFDSFVKLNSSDSDKSQKLK
jgi:hypothetical protein